MKYFMQIIAAYILAAPLTDKISLDLRLTDWLNLWTYIIWVLSFGVWALVALFILFLVGLVVSK